MTRAGKHPSTVLSGIGLAPGISMATAYRIEPQSAAFYRIRIAPQEAARELKRFRKALEKSRQQLRRAKKKFEAEVGKEHSHIIDAHLLILEDRHLIQGIEQKIEGELQSSERAVREAAESWLAAYRALDDPFFQERGSDLEEVAERLVSNLVELSSDRVPELPEDLVLVTAELSLLVLAEYPLERVKGLVLERGGKTSHAIIVARSCRIPVVSGIPDLESLIRTGDTLIVDGTSGAVHIRPSEKQINFYQVRAREEKKKQEELVGDLSPCTTMDGRRIFLYANAEIGTEVPLGFKLGAEGIGLFRSEYIYMRDREAPVAEAKQFKIYRDLARSAGDRPVIIRTLDLGNEEHPYFSSIIGRAGDALLGLRGIRLSLAHPEIYKTQLRAVLRASNYGNLKIVLPMVSSVEEVLQAKELMQVVKEELTQQGLAFDRGIEIGAMLEVPATIFILEAIAPHVSFFAVGTNDLIQYTLAVGRTDHRVAHLSNPLHPAVLRSLHRVLRVAGDYGRTALVCGEVASNPGYASLLVGMGFQHLSMNPFAVPEIKQVLRQINYAEASEVVAQVLQLSTVKEIQACVKKGLAVRPAALTGASRR